MGPSSQSRVDRSTALARAAGERARVRSVDQLTRANVGGSFASRLLSEQTRDVEQGVAGIIPEELQRMAGLGVGVAQQPVQEIGSGKGPQNAQYAEMGGALIGTLGGAALGGPPGAVAGGQIGGAAGGLAGGGGKPGGRTRGGSVKDVGGGWGNFSTGSTYNEQPSGLPSSLPASPNYGLRL